MVKFGVVKFLKYLFKINIMFYLLYNFILIVIDVWISIINVMLKVIIFVVYLKFDICIRIMLNLIVYVNENVWVLFLVYVND